MNHSMAVMTSSENMKWATPQEWFDYLDLEFGFTLDPCCEHETAKCAKHYTPAEDGLGRSWADERVFMNPPYGREIGPWMRKAYRECRDNGALVVCFVPARVDTNWWHDYAAKATEIRFPKGRVTFAGATAAAPFPVAVVVFRPRIGIPNNRVSLALPRKDQMDNQQTPVAGERSAQPAGSLLPCPFCGGQPDETWDDKDRPIIECRDCQSRTGRSSDFVAAAARWNSRANNSLSGPATASGVGYAGGVGSVKDSR